MKRTLTDFEIFMIKTHPDPESCMFIKEGKTRDGREVRVYFDYDEMVDMVERYIKQLKPPGRQPDLRL